MSPRHASIASGFRAILPWLGLALVLLLADQYTKRLILGHYQWGEGTLVTSFFNIVRVHNTGAAFSFLADAAGWQRWFFSSISVGASIFILWMLWTHTQQKLFCFAMACILSGAIGNNLIDRVLYGYVVDFLDFHWRGMHFPAFNVADSAISIGAVCLITDELLRMRRGQPG
jgi:signal peptidase II